MIVDGLPIDNKTTNTGNLASDAPTSALAFSNRNVDFTNRAADINPEDIESLTVLKGPEASALYGIDAANGAIVITTKRGRSGTGGFDYSNSFSIVQVRATAGHPEHLWPERHAQHRRIRLRFLRVLRQPHTPPTPAARQHRQLLPDGRHAEAQPVVQRRDGGQSADLPHLRFIDQTGRCHSEHGAEQINLTGRSTGVVSRWMTADLSMTYTYANNDKAFKGDDGPLIGLLAWPDTNNAANWLSPAGTRARITGLSKATEVDNPYFAVNKNKSNEKTNHIIVNGGLDLLPFSWGHLKTNIGTDSYTSQHLMLRHPESAMAGSSKGIIDINNDITRNLNAQTLFTVNERQIAGGLSLSGLVGNAVLDQKSTVDGAEGVNFLDPNFVSINNTLTKSDRTIITQRRLVSAFGQATANFKNYLYVTATGRNDWTSTIPVGAELVFLSVDLVELHLQRRVPGPAEAHDGQAARRIRRGRARRAAVLVSHHARVEDDVVRRVRIRLYRTEPASPAGVCQVLRIRHGAELHERPPRPRCHVLPQADREPDRPESPRELRNGLHSVQPERRLDGEPRNGDIGSRHAGASRELLVGFPRQLREGARQDCVAAERAAGVVRLRHVAVRQRPERHAAGSLDDVVDRIVLPAQQQGPDPHRSDDGPPASVSAFIDHGYDRQPNFTIGLSNNIRVKRADVELPVRHQEGRRHLQRDRALSHHSRTLAEHARSQHAASHRRASCATAKRTPPTRRRTRSSSCRRSRRRSTRA